MNSFIQLVLVALVLITQQSKVNGFDTGVNGKSKIKTVSGIPNCENGNDQIDSLPGWNSALPSPMYSGFIEVNSTANV